MATQPSPLTSPAHLALGAGVSTRLWLGRVARIAAWLAFIAVLALTLYGTSVHAVGGNSDGATVILEGKALAAGNLTLSGWSLSLDSFWTVDVLFNALAVAIFGVHPFLVNLVPVVIATLVVLTGFVMLRDLPNRAGAVAGGVFVLVMLGMPSPDLAYYLLQGPLHVGTVLWCLLAFLCLRKGRFNWWWALSVVLLAFAMLGDLQGFAIGVVPVLLGAFVAARRLRSVRRAFPEVAAALASVALAVIVRVIALAIGTFRYGSTHSTAHGHQLLTNVANIPSRSLELLGAQVTPIWAMTSEPFYVVAARTVGVVLIVLAVLIGLFRLGRGVLLANRDHDERWRIDDLLVFAFFGDLVVFVVLSATAGNYSRYLTGAIIFATILGARLLGQLRTIPWPRALAAVAAVVILAIGVGYGRDLAKPEADVPLQALSQFLVLHHLSQGIADYPSSSILTVETSDAIVVRPVIEGPGGHLVRFERQSSDDWYRNTSFNFLVFNAQQQWRGVDAATAIATFGQPAARYSIDKYEVFVWSAPIHVAVRGSTGVSPS